MYTRFALCARAPHSLAALCLAAALGGCDGGTSSKTAEAVTPLVVQRVHEQRAMLERQSSQYAMGNVQVFVDESLTMQPFAAAGPEAPFGQLLNHLHESLGGKVTFFGFGFASARDSAQAITPASLDELLRPASYTRVHNDYGALFASLAKTPDTKVVVTDGVQSDREAGARFGGVVEAAQAHLARGGVFGAYVFRSPYEGTYYRETSTCPGPMPYACAGRPVVAFVFAPSGQALDQFGEYLHSGGLREVAAVRTDGQMAVRLAEETLPAGESAEARRGARTVKVLSDVDAVPVQGYTGIAVGRVRPAAVSDKGFLPLQFDLTMDSLEARRLGPAGVAEAFRTLRPTLQAWGVHGRAGKDLSVSEARSVFVETQSGPSDVTVRGNTARLVVPVRRPEGLDNARQIVWLLTLRPAEASAVRLVPEAISTSTDCAAEACERALNLRPLLGAILNRTHVQGRLLFLTDWKG